MNKYLYLFVLLIYSCGIEKSKEKQTNITNHPSKSAYFKNLIGRIDFVTLPYTHDLANGEETICSYQFDEMGYDTLFLNREHSQIIGLLPDTNNFIGLLYFYPGDDMVPGIITFDKQGNMISDESTIVSGCSSGYPCSFFDCEASFELSNDLQIISKERLETKNCESPEDNNCISLSQIGRIQKNGKISLNKPIKTVCK